MLGEQSGGAHSDANIHMFRFRSCTGESRRNDRLRMPSRVTPILLLSIVGAWLASPPVRAVDTVLVPTGAVWRYLDNGSNQGTAWRAAGVQRLVVGAGPGRARLRRRRRGDRRLVRRQRQQQVRHHLLPALFPGQRRRLLRRRHAAHQPRRRRRRLPQRHRGVPHQHARRGDQLHHAGVQRRRPRTTFVQTAIDPSLLVEGTNVLAVEIHQTNATSSDISFDLELDRRPTASGSRADRTCSSATPTSIVVRWRTNVADLTRVALRHDARTTSIRSVDRPGAHHRARGRRSTGSIADTRYYYAVGTTAEILAGGDAQFTRSSRAPPPGTRQPTRVWVLGDSGTANANAARGARRLRRATAAPRPPTSG